MQFLQLLRLRIPLRPFEEHKKEQIFFIFFVHLNHSMYESVDTSSSAINLEIFRVEDTLEKMIDHLRVCYDILFVCVCELIYYFYLFFLLSQRDEDTHRERERALNLFSFCFSSPIQEIKISNIAENINANKSNGFAKSKIKRLS